MNRNIVIGELLIVSAILMVIFYKSFAPFLYLDLIVIFAIGMLTGGVYLVTKEEEKNGRN